MSYSLGSEMLDWYFELGDLIADEIVIREVFGIPEGTDIKTSGKQGMPCPTRMRSANEDLPRRLQPPTT
jgi:hypothetical protein